MKSLSHCRILSVPFLLSLSPWVAAHAAIRPVLVPANAAAPLSSVLAPTVIRSSGAIEADVEAFRALLGNPNNNATSGQQPTGHRAINWDGVPAAVTNAFDFPADFFNVNSPRGLVYEHTTRGLQVSDRGFSDINATYAAEFKPFSGSKVFSPIGNNKSDVRFFVAGSATEAAVTGFGVVFMDVDTAGSTGLLLIGKDGRSLGRILAPVRSDARGASFVGVVFRNPVIHRVRIVTGDGRLASNEIDVTQGGAHDLVVMDDFIYGEPTATGQ
jgi:hypothetical protein